LTAGEIFELLAQNGILPEYTLFSENKKILVRKGRKALEDNIFLNPKKG
jgi:hypothetical protein